MNSCRNCSYSMIDPKWGEFKCKAKARYVTKSEKEKGCDNWKEKK